MNIIDEFVLFERTGVGKSQQPFINQPGTPAIKGAETIYQNTTSEKAHYMNIESVQPRQPDQGLNHGHYISLETETREASKIPSIYKRMIGQKSRSHQPEPLNADSKSPIHINTVAQ